jgi:hypothetical protein
MNDESLMNFSLDSFKDFDPHIPCELARLRILSTGMVGNG